MKKIIVKGVFIALLFSLGSCNKQDRTSDSANEYIVAAYIWPSCHDEPRSREILWPDSIGEWEIIKQGDPRFEGHYQPKVPLWGYEMDDNPKVMEKWIELATDHGINTFIFDWYWFDQGPFLESCLNNGFLKAPNNEKMNFYIMWADHDVKANYWNVRRNPDDESLLFEGKADWMNFKIFVKRVIEQYFTKPNYLKIDGQPIFSVYNLKNLIQTFGSEEETVKGMDYFRQEVIKAGFPGLHLQMVTNDKPNEKLNHQIEVFGINSVTQYNWGGGNGLKGDYIRWGVNNLQHRQAWNNASVPFFPNVSIGWDATPRFPQQGADDVIHYHNTPQSFAMFLEKAKEYVDARPNRPKLITIYAFNEWVEGSYLLPDMKYGYGYVEAVKDVIVDGKYDKYNPYNHN